VIHKKRKGGKIAAPEQESEPEPAEDLMAALERTLETVKGKGKSGKAKSRSGKKGKSGKSRSKAATRG
jgi:non-homologous end joining protein Ku